MQQPKADIFKASFKIYMNSLYIMNPFEIMFGGLLTFECIFTCLLIFIEFLNVKNIIFSL